MIKKIDKRKRFYMVFDTETTALEKDTFNAPLIYDIGFAICDKQGRIYEEYNFIVRNIFYSDLMKNAFFANKKPWYEEQIKKGNILVRDFGQIIHNMNLVMSRYPNITLAAYNLDFDTKALKSTAKLTNQKRFDGTLRSLFDKHFDIQDIWSLAVESIYLPQKRFKKFILEHSLYTPKGNVQTSAEIGYRYITNDNTFIEDHTALSDVHIEVEILAHALKQNKRYTKGVLKGPWKLLVPYKRAI